jgi:hypothetical protein
MKMKSFTRIIVFTFLLSCWYAAWTQQPQVVTPKAPYDSTKTQLTITKEENLQLKANAAQQAFQQQMKDMQAQWQADETSVNAWIADVKKANGWDDTYVYDREKDQWTHVVKEAPKK